MSDAAAIPLAHPLAPEDQARADLYALLARLYAAPPDATLLDLLARASPMGLPTTIDAIDSKAAQLGGSWDALRAASSVMDAEAAAQEYADLFVGVGRSEVNLHASHWLTGFMMDKPLVEVRASLATLGLGRRAGITMAEDHVAALFETMRLLVAGHDDRSPSTVVDQRMFFETHIAPWIERCCAAISANYVANYYRRVAEFTDSFMALERDSFAIES